LGQIISGDVAKAINAKRRNSQGGFSVGQDPAFVDIIGKRQTKRYETEGSPVELAPFVVCVAIVLSALCLVADHCGFSNSGGDRADLLTLSRVEGAGSPGR